MWNRASPLLIALCWLICFLPAKAQIEIDGRLEGVLSGIYIINGNVWVEAGDSLTIMPATELQFNGQYSFTVYGYLSAVGTETDSIKFLPKTGVVNWSGLKFNSADDSSRLEFCLITGSNDHGIYLNNASPVIIHCNVSNNSTFWHGGGIRCENASTPLIIDCIVSQNTSGANNTGDSYGGGISLDNSPAVITNCLIDNNVARTSGGGISCWYSDAIIQGGSIVNNTLSCQLGGKGGGFYSWNSNIIITDSEISNNHLNGSNDQGAGIYFNNNGTVTSNAIVTNCIINGNSMLTGGFSGIKSYQVSTVINHCVIANNVGIGIGGTATIYVMNSTISGNTGSFLGNGNAINCAYGLFYMSNCIVDNNVGNNQSVYFQNMDSINISYCDFFNNQGANFAGQTIPQLGIISTVNANNDPCDVFNNIFLDPQFVDATNGDYHLTQNSPCINAGDPTSPLDPDSTIADMGAFYFDLTNAVVNPKTNLPGANLLLTNYPNPFNNATNMVFNLPADGSASLAIYNIAGGLITTLVDDAFLRAGEHEVRFECATLSSGIYFATLQQGATFETKKLLLIK